MNENPCKWTRIAPGIYRSELGTIDRYDIAPGRCVWNVTGAGEREAHDSYETLKEAKASLASWRS